MQGLLRPPFPRMRRFDPATERNNSTDSEFLKEIAIDSQCRKLAGGRPKNMARKRGSSPTGDLRLPNFECLKTRIFDMIDPIPAGAAGCKLSKEQTMSRSFALALAVLTVTISTTAAGEVKGEWTRDDGKTRVRFASCGSDAVCGAITWLKDKDSPAKVGEQVFFDMKPSGENVWAGTAFNPDDGKRYSGKMTLNGDRLLTAGCVLGGLICKSFSWTRAR